MVKIEVKSYVLQKKIVVKFQRLPEATGVVFSKRRIRRGQRGRDINIYQMVG
jgi:hypothetical protein